MRCAEAARLPETGEQTGAVITSEMIRSYLETLSRRGRSRNTVQMYGAKLRAFYHYLPSDKRGEEAECNPWCLRKLYLATRSEIERNVRLPAEQAYEQILDAEQLAAGWTENESNSIQKDVCDRYFLAEGCKGGEEMKKRIVSAGRGLASRILRSIRMDRTCGKTPQRKAGNRRPWKVGPPMNRMAPVRQMSRGLQGIQRKMSRQRFREIPLRGRIPRPPRSLRESWIP